MSDTNLDRFVYGAKAIGREADIYEEDENGEIVIDENGKPKVDVRKAHYALEKGLHRRRQIRPSVAQHSAPYPRSVRLHRPCRSA
jgi:hypothetical protein